MTLSDYEKQSWCIRWFRWWRYMPLMMVYGTCKLIWWTIKGRQLMENCNQQQTAQLVWRSATARAEYDMGLCLLLDEIIQEFRDKEKP